MPNPFIESLIQLEPGSFTCIMVKPDIYSKHLNDILHIIDLNEFETLNSFDGELSKPLVRGLYYENIGKEFFQRNLEFILSGKVFVAILKAPNAVLKWRSLMGPTDSSRAHPDTLRGMFGNPHVMHENGVHGSDSPVSALRESMLFFGD